MMVLPSTPTRVDSTPTNQSPQAPLPVSPMKATTSPAAPAGGLPIIMALPKDLYKKKRFHREKKMRMRRSLSMPSSKKQQQLQQLKQEEGGSSSTPASPTSPPAPLSPDRWGTNSRNTSLTRSRSTSNSNRKTSRPSSADSATSSSRPVAQQQDVSTTRFTEGQPAKRDSSIRLPKRQRSCSPGPTTTSSPSSPTNHTTRPLSLKNKNTGSLQPPQRSRSNVETVMDLIDTVLDQLSVQSGGTTDCDCDTVTSRSNSNSHHSHSNSSSIIHQ